MTESVQEVVGQLVVAVVRPLITVGCRATGRAGACGDGDGGERSVVYVPPGTPTTERPFAETWRGAYPQPQLRTLWRQLSWPDDEGDCNEEGEWRDVSGELGEVWSDVTGRPPA